MTAARITWIAAFVVSAAACGGEESLSPTAPWAIAVASFEPGDGAGFGQDRLPDVVLGPPLGAGTTMGSLDVLSLGDGGSITLELGAAAIDAEGPDLIVFENAFRFGAGLVFTEPGIVAASEDGLSFVEWPCDLDGAREGCAGMTPVYANAMDGNVEPTDPDAAGGDAFDLADIGLSSARFVRIRDAGVSRDFGGDSAGFDLDAIAVIHRAAP